MQPIFGGRVYSGTGVCFKDFFLAMDQNSSLLYVFIAVKGPVFALYQQNYNGSSWQSETLPVIRVEMKDLVYIQVILNGTWQSRAAKASAGTPLHINK